MKKTWDNEDRLEALESAISALEDAISALNALGDDPSDLEDYKEQYEEEARGIEAALAQEDAEELAALEREYWASVL